MQPYALTFLPEASELPDLRLMAERCQWDYLVDFDDDGDLTFTVYPNNVTQSLEMITLIHKDFR